MLNLSILVKKEKLRHPQTVRARASALWRKPQATAGGCGVGSGIRDQNESFIMPMTRLAEPWEWSTLVRDPWRYSRPIVKSLMML